MFYFNSWSHHGSWWCYISVLELQSVNSEPEIASCAPLSGSWYHGSPFSLCVTPLKQEILVMDPWMNFRRSMKLYPKLYVYAKENILWKDSLQLPSTSRCLMASSKNGKDTLLAAIQPDLGNKFFLQCNSTCRKSKCMTLQAYWTCLTEVIGRHLGSQTEKAGILVWICNYHDDSTLLPNRTTHCITTCKTHLFPFLWKLLHLVVLEESLQGHWNWSSTVWP